jgi:hypothetical protein
MLLHRKKKILHNYKKNYEILLLLMPFHPSVYSEFLKQQTVIQEVENQIRLIAQKENITVHGSYNPIDTFCHGLDFYDGGHPKESCVIKIVHNIN